MTDFSQLIQPDKGQSARTIHLIIKKDFEGWLKQQPETIRQLVEAYRFTGNPEGYLLLPYHKGKTKVEGEEQTDFMIVAGVKRQENLHAWALAKLATRLPEGTYRLIGRAAGDAMLGWMLAQHDFDRYRKASDKQGARVLLTHDVAKIDEMTRQAEATALVRDLVNTPAADMGPDRLEEQAKLLADRYKAKLQVTKGDALETGYPLIHGVGKAAMRGHAPRLIEMFWGKDDHPKISVIGKGISFDTGGLSMKTPAGMLLMKKDMGGAAHALALAQLIMDAGLPVRLHLLIPAAENAIDGNAVRPSDILQSRKGITVEVGNTDAEGRLVLADAMTRAGEEEPELMIDFATLTGAARIALGPDLPALFSNNDDVAHGLIKSGRAVDDPVWRMPLWQPYAANLNSTIADTNNVAGALGGCITAALFLQKFVPTKTPWAHFDTYAWRPAAKTGRPKGGEALGLRASWAYLKQRYEG